VLYRGGCTSAFLAAIVAASNAGGAGSVVGDTTTTMMWIAGVSPIQVFEAYVAAVPALLFFGVIAARQQHAYQPISKDAPAGVRVDGGRLVVVATILVAAVAANVYFNLRHPEVLNRVPVIGLAVWIAIVATMRSGAPTGACCRRRRAAASSCSRSCCARR
jgi:Na+/H+ antiporter NhaD/arsenite permease-like protein